MRWFRRKGKYSTVVYEGPEFDGVQLVRRKAWERAVDDLTLYFRDQRPGLGNPTLSDRAKAREIVDVVQNSLRIKP